MIKLCEKATPASSSSDELTYLRHALKTIREVVITINDAISSRDRARELLELQQAFNESPLISVDSPGRALVRCGQLQKLCRNGYKPFFFVLCTDVIFYGEEVTGVKLSNSKFKYIFNRAIHISDLQIILQVPTAVVLSGETESVESVKSFILRGKDKAFEVVAKTAADCVAWVNDLIQLKTLSNSGLSSQKQTPFYTKNHIFTINIVISNIPVDKHVLPSGSGTTGDSSLREVSMTVSDMSTTGCRHRVRTIQSKRYSVHRSVDLTTGVLFVSDLVDERAGQVGEPKIRLNRRGGMDHASASPDLDLYNCATPNNDIDHSLHESSCMSQIQPTHSTTSSRNDHNPARSVDDVAASSVSSLIDLPDSEVPDCRRTPSEGDDTGIWGQSDEVLVPISADPTVPDFLSS
mmetsp:Transcript_4104/g.7521  ORF Transcript_4104/g.7521 Transcript_4104/m.7521 type:complete len:407 (-) Transcript_4104:33-1253(-)